MYGGTTKNNRVYGGAKSQMTKPSGRPGTLKSPIKTAKITLTNVKLKHTDNYILGEDLEKPIKRK